MGSFGPLHWIVVAIVVLVLFGRGRISEVMGDFGKGIKSFKQGMADEHDRPVTPPPAQIAQTPPPAPTSAHTPAAPTENGTQNPN